MASRTVPSLDATRVHQTASRPRRPAQVEAEKQAASGLAKMGLVDPSLRKKEHGPKAAARVTLQGGGARSLTHTHSHRMHSPK